MPRTYQKNHNNLTGWTVTFPRFRVENSDVFTRSKLSIWLRGMHFKLAIIFCSFFLFISKPSFSNENPEDQYRQMGGIVGLTELCFGSKDLQNLLFQQVGSVFYNNPEMGRAMFELLYVYFDSYEVAKSDQVIWNGSQQAYNTNAFDCSDENKTLIKTFEQQLINGLQ